MEYKGLLPWVLPWVSLVKFRSTVLGETHLIDGRRSRKAIHLEAVISCDYTNTCRISKEGNLKMGYNRIISISDCINTGFTRVNTISKFN